MPMCKECFESNTEVNDCEHDWNDTNTEVDNDGMFLVQFECILCKIKGNHRFSNMEIIPIGGDD